MLFKKHNINLSLPRIFELIIDFSLIFLAIRFGVILERILHGEVWHGLDIKSFNFIVLPVFWVLYLLFFEKRMNIEKLKFNEILYRLIIFCYIGTTTLITLSFLVEVDLFHRATIFFSFLLMVSFLFIHRCIIKAYNNKIILYNYFKIIRLLFIYDILTIIFSLLLVHLISNETIFNFQLRHTLYSLIMLFFLYYNGLYKINRLNDNRKHFFYYFISLGVFILFIQVFQPFYKSEINFSINIINLFFVLSAAGIFRIILASYLTSQSYADNDLQQNVVIIGSGSILELLATEITRSSNSIYKLIGFIDDTQPIGEYIYLDYRNLSTSNSIDNLLKETKIDEVIIADNDLSIEDLIKNITDLKRYNIKLSLFSSKYDIISKRIPEDVISISSLYSINKQFDSNSYKFIKRLFDLSLSILLIIFLAPILFTIGLIIKLTSKGPIIFTQNRIGLNGNLFTFYKFRTMIVGSDIDPQRKKEMTDFIKSRSSNDKNSKIVNKSNITSIGTILRKYSLDELPQLFNVLKGDMSLIGPRPLLEYEYQLLKNWHKRRHFMKPGCSGLWQIFGRSKTNFEEMIIMDMYYIDNTSPFLDMKLFIKTIPVMLMGNGGG